MMNRRRLAGLAAALLLGVLPGLVPTPTGPLAPRAAVGAQPVAECTLPIGGDVGAIDFEHYQRPIGSVRALMIFVDFPDAPAAGSTATPADLFLPEAIDWYRRASYGRLQLSVTTVPGWFRMPHSSTSYGFDRGLSFDAHRDYITDAVAAADASVNFAGYQLYYIVANPEATAISFSPAFVGGDFSGVTADGATIGLAATFGADMWNWGFKVLNHETGHLFGLPDLYAFEGDDDHRFVGGWDMMGLISGHAPDYLGWFKWQVGWLAPSQIVCLNTVGTTTIALTPLSVTGGRKLVLLRTGTRTLIAAEYRTATGNDAAACDEGVLIYRINNGIATGAGPIRVVDAQPGEGIQEGCDFDLDNSAFDPLDPVFEDDALGITINVTDWTDESATVEVSRTIGWTPPDVRHARRLTITSSARSGGLVTVTGQLTVPDGYNACRTAQSLTLQRLVSGKWTNVRTALTTSTGTWTYRWRAPVGTYRLTAPQKIIGSRPRNLCLAVTSSTRAIR